MTRAARILATGAVVLAAACGGSSTNSGGGSNTPTTGTATFSGDATGTLPVYVLGNFISGGTYTTLSILSGVFGSTATVFPNFGFEAQIPGPTLETGSFESPGNTAQTDYLNQAMQTWGQFSGSNPFGSFSLTLLSVGSSTSGAANTTVWFSAHGTLSATMIPANGNSMSGDVNVSVSF